MVGVKKAGGQAGRCVWSKEASHRLFAWLALSMAVLGGRGGASIGTFSIMQSSCSTVQAKKEQTRIAGRASHATSAHGWKAKMVGGMVDVVGQGLGVLARRGVRGAWSLAWWVGGSVGLWIGGLVRLLWGAGGWWHGLHRCVALVRGCWHGLVGSGIA